MKTISIFSKQERIVLFALFVAIWSYLWLKSILAPMSHDELATFYHFIQHTAFLPFFCHLDANNHVLNSALTSLFYILFGNSPFVLRLANLLSFIPYFYFAVKLSTHLKSGIIRWVFIITLSTSAGLIEFFALCRGYGMSMAFLLGSIYYLMQIFKTNQTKYFLLCLLLALLAFAANLTLLVSFLIIFVWILSHYILKFNSGFRRNLTLILAYLFMAIIPIAVFLKYIFLLQKTGALYYGNLSGFWQLSIHSISFMFTGIASPFFPYLFLVLFICILLIFILIIFKEKITNLFFDPAMIFFMLLCLNIISILLMGKVMKVNYPEDRTGLYLFPYFIGSLCFLSDKAILLSKKNWILILLFPLVFFPVNLIYSANLGRCNIYLLDRFPQRFFDTVYNHYKPEEFPATIGGNCTKLICWNYYNYRKDGSQSTVQDWNFPSNDEDYQIVMPHDIDRWKTYYDSLDIDKYSGLLLLKKKQPYLRSLIDSILVSSNFSNTEEYFNLFETKTDSLNGKTLYLGYKLNISSCVAPFNAHIIIDVQDKNGKGLYYQNIRLNWLKLHYAGDKINFINGMLIHKLPPEAASLKSYIWNIDKAPYEVSGNLYLYELK
jgi:hypothetical protein